MQLTSDLNSIKDYPCNHDGNASRILDLWGHLIRYDAATESWVIWKGTRWITERKDTKAAKVIMGYARKQAYEILPALIGRYAVSDPIKAVAFEKWAYESQCKLKPTVEMVLSRSEELYSMITEWDNEEHIHLLIAANKKSEDAKVIDLRDGSTRDVVPTDRMTKRVYISYDPTAECPRWKQFLEEIFDGDAEMVNYIHRLIGYCMTGETREKKLFFLYGPRANNGKSTLIDVISFLLEPDYLKKIPAKAFMKYRNANPNAANENIASLRGARLAVADETERQDQLNASLLKELTGVRDRITARHNYGSNFSFIPTNKLFVLCNELPSANFDDQGLWNRIQCIPFNVVFGKDKPEDKEIYGKLQAELPGILAWAVRGAIDYYRDGLQAPAQVTLTTNEYREEEDTLQMFLDEACSLDTAFKVVRSTLYSAYQYWCENRKEFAVPSRVFYQSLRRKGFKEVKIGVMHFKGVKAKPLSGGLGQLG